MAEFLNASPGSNNEKATFGRKAVKLFQLPSP